MTTAATKRFPKNDMTVQDIHNLALERLSYWGVDPAWSFKFNKLKNSVGICRYRPKTIELSIHFLNRSRDAIITTLDHEIAHIFCPGDGHGPEWQQKMRDMGHAAERLAKVQTDERPSYKYGIFHGDVLVKGYHNRPSAKVFAGLPFLYVTGQPQTRGQLVVKKMLG